MKILIVDDNVARLSQLTEFFTTTASINIDTLAFVESMNEAKEILRRTYFDVLILDVVLPKRKNETASFRNSLELLDLLSRSPTYRKPEKIIALTAHLEDIGKYRNDFERFCLAVIEANEITVGWKTRILESIQFTFGSKIIRSRASNLATSKLRIQGISSANVEKTPYL